MIFIAHNMGNMPQDQPTQKITLRALSAAINFLFIAGLIVLWVGGKKRTSPDIHRPVISEENN